VVGTVEILVAYDRRPSRERESTARDEVESGV